MEIKLDVKTLFIGFAAGIVITMALGAGSGSADAARFGISIPVDGSALVQVESGDFYIVNARNGMATRVLYSNINSNPSDRRNSKGDFFP